MDFQNAVRESLQRGGYKPRSGHELLEWWDNFVKQCEDGYDWTIYEFDDELSVRDYIEAVLDDAVLGELPQYSDFKEHVIALDERFRTLLQSHVGRPSSSKAWWRKGILRYAGDEYRSDIESRYSVAVQPYAD